MPTDTKNPITIFYSYSHKDEKFRDDLSSSLALMKRQGLVKEWYDGNLVPGEKWDDKIYTQLNAADIILLLISRDFINSDFIWGKELRSAMNRNEAREARVVPVIIRPTDWQGSPIGALQALPKNANPITLWSNRDAAWLDVAKGVRKAIEELRTGVSSTPARTVTPLAPIERETSEPKSLQVEPVSTSGEAPMSQLQRTIYNADNSETLTGTIARREGEPPTGDVAVDEAYDFVGVTYNFFANIFKRDSIDGKGMPLEVVVHYGINYDNGFWSGRQIILGDGDGKLFNRFTISPEIVAKEFANGVIQNETQLEYWQQSGALFDSLAIVLATMVKQYHFKQTVSQADWLIGDKLLGKKVKGKALFSLANPGSAYDDAVLGKDSQPAHMHNFVKTEMDNGGIHINAGIPNHVFFLVATAMGGYSWERAGRIWYESMLDNRLEPKAQFCDFARLTHDNARRIYGNKSEEAGAVRDGWSKVGVQITKTKISSTQSRMK